MRRLAVHPLVSALLCSGVISLSSPQAFAQAPILPKEFRTAISLNGQTVGSWTLLERNGVLYASQEAFEAWQIRRRIGAEGISHAGQTWYPLASKIRRHNSSTSISSSTISIFSAAIISLPSCNKNLAFSLLCKLWIRLGSNHYPNYIPLYHSYQTNVVRYKVLIKWVILFRQ